MAIDIWRDIANNKVYVKNGLETIEVPHAIAEAYRQDEDKDFRLLYSAIDSLNDDVRFLESENAKLRELVHLLLYGVDHEMNPADALVWSDRVNRLAKELGVDS